MTFEELDYKVVDWAAQRFLGDATVDGQFRKFIEEGAEIGKAISSGDVDEMKDAIGDTLVTLILLARIQGFDPVECLEYAYGQIANRTGRTVNGVFVKDE